MRVMREGCYIKALTASREYVRLIFGPADAHSPTQVLSFSLRSTPCLFNVLTYRVFMGSLVLRIFASA